MWGRVQVQAAACPPPPAMASPSISRYRWSFDACSHAHAIFYHLEGRDADEKGCTHVRHARVSRWEQQHRQALRSNAEALLAATLTGVKLQHKSVSCMNLLPGTSSVVSRVYPQLFVLQTHLSGMYLHARRAASGGFPWRVYTSLRPSALPIGYFG